MCIIHVSDTDFLFLYPAHCKVWSVCNMDAEDQLKDIHKCLFKWENIIESWPKTYSYCNSKWNYSYVIISRNNLFHLSLRPFFPTSDLVSSYLIIITFSYHINTHIFYYRNIFTFFFLFALSIRHVCQLQVPIFSAAFLHFFFLKSGINFRTFISNLSSFFCCKRSSHIFLFSSNLILKLKILSSFLISKLLNLLFYILSYHPGTLSW